MLSKEELHDMYWNQSMSQREIAKEIGVHPGNVANWMKKYRIGSRTISKSLLIGVCIPTKNEVRRMYLDQKMTIQQIMKEVGVSYNTIRNLMAQYGIKPRTNSECKLIGVCVPTENELRQMYLDRMMIMGEIAKELGIGTTIIYNLMKQYEIVSRTHSEASIGKYTGENSKNWNGGTSFEPYCNKFNNTFKEAVRRRDDYTCQLCGLEQLLGGIKLSIHHIHYDRENCYPDVVTLCRSCNSRVNSDRDYWEDYFETHLIVRGLLNWRMD